MGFTKETLEKLCCCNKWSYGVFWSFDQRNSMLLTVEESYCEEKMAALLNNMIFRVQMLGEGFVGRAALTGKNQWIYSDAYNGGWGSMAQDDLEIQSQFSCGLKTFAVIPVDTKGVLQFGSTHKILETSEFLDQIRRADDMNTIGFSDNSSSSLSYENCDLNEWFASFCNGNITPMCGSSYNELMEIACTSTNFDRSSFEFQQEKIESLCLDSPCFDLKSQFHQSEFSVENLASDIPCFSTWSNQDSVLTSLESTESFKLDDFDTKQFDCFTSDNVLEWFSSTPDHGIKNFEGSVNPVQNSITDVGHDPSKALVMENISGKSVDWSESLNFDHFASTFGVSLESQFAKPANSVQSSITDAYVPKLDVKSINGPKKGLFSELGLEELLNSSTSSSYIPNSKRRRLENSSAGCISSSNNSALWIDDSYSINNGPSNPANPKKQVEPTKATKKRAKPGESTRPRPKDRQQIQDRMKELKEIIPDGAKCSIDALLDRTIKYMLFLQGVTKNADKIKQLGEPKLIGEANGKIAKENTSGKGATWAIEVGDQSTVCPIIVEDLASPGLMLIEMLCEDRGFFLELADVIRGFGLNVLKGEMEARGDKIWARFIVEVKLNITRIDVFWSLVQLLQLASTDGMDSTNQTVDICPDSGLNRFEPPLLCPVSVAEALR